MNPISMTNAAAANPIQTLGERNQRHSSNANAATTNIKISEGVKAQVSGIDNKTGAASNASLPIDRFSRRRRRPYRASGTKKTVKASRICEEPKSTASGYRANPQAA